MMIEFDPLSLLMLLQESGAPPLVPGGEGAPGNGAGAGNGEPGGGPGGQPGGLFSGGGFLLLLLAVLVVMIIFSAVGQRRERKKREEMINAVKKHDKIQTVGGVIGSVVEVKPDTVVLKVDESSNTRITFARSAIQQVIKSSGAPADGDPELKES